MPMDGRAKGQYDFMTLALRSSHRVPGEPNVEEETIPERMVGPDSHNVLQFLESEATSNITSVGSSCDDGRHEGAREGRRAPPPPGGGCERP